MIADDLDRTRDIAETARIIEKASGGVVLTRGGDVLPLPGLPDDRLLAPGSPIPTASPTSRPSDRRGGIVSVIGVYGGLVDKFPAGAWMNRSLTLRTGQCDVQRYMRPLLGRIERGEIDPTRVITHRLPLAEAPQATTSSRERRTAARRWC